MLQGLGLKRAKGGYHVPGVEECVLLNWRVTVWSICRTRSERLFNNGVLSAEEVVDKITVLVSSKSSFKTEYVL